MKKMFATLGLLALLSPAATARANGRFPSAGHVEVDPADPEHIVLRATYGLVVTRDGGKRWDWVCEKAMYYNGVWDPPIGITSEGAILVGLPDGLSKSTADACSFSRIPEFDGRLVADLAVDKKNPGRAVVLSLIPLGLTFDSRIFATKDGGKTFADLGGVFPGNFRGLTVDLCPSDPQIIYVSGLLDGPMPQGVVMRSGDGGKTYETFVLPNSDDTRAPFIGAVDPQNAQRVYVRLDGTPGRLLVSEDGGKTWSELFAGEGTLLGFSLAPDGKQLVVGGEKDGVWRSPAPNWAFERTSLLHARCFRWAEAGIYACAEPVVDGYSVGLSVTQGSTFKPLAKLSDLCGPISCLKPVCSADWPTLRDTIGATACIEGSSSSSSGGMGGSGGNAGNAHTSNGSGCGCRIGRDSPHEMAGAVCALILLGWRRRRQKAYLARHSNIP